MNKKTIKDKITLKGVGLHSGKNIKIEIVPSNNGKIEFIRNNEVIEALYKNVVDTNFAVTIGKNGNNISTIEHLLAAFHGLGVDSARIYVDGPEIPILDGSALPFVQAIEDIGLEKIGEKREYFTIEEPLEIRMGEKYLLFLPSDRLKINYTISFNHPLLDKQTLKININKNRFIKEISQARTFTFLSVVNDLKAKGLIKGGSLDNAIVLDENGVYNGELRIEKECVRHKILDFIGDIYLLGMPIKGKVIAYKSGHTLDIKAVKTLANYKKRLEKVPLSASSAIYITNYFQK